LQLACAQVLKHVISESGTERPKRLKLDKEMRKQKAKSLEDIAALNKQIAVKQKRLPARIHLSVIFSIAY